MSEAFLILDDALCLSKMEMRAGYSLAPTNPTAGSFRSTILNRGYSLPVSRHFRTIYL